MTTVLYPHELAHLVQVVSDRQAGHRAECSCGWAGAWVDEPPLAAEAADDHREDAVGPPTGLDAALSGLLDLQDDLADVVMWLAENWAADLPDPYATSSCHYRANGDAIPGVRLLVYCDSRDDLVRLADLLDAALTVDPAPNTLGSRYEHATRRFGRVELNAYREFDHDTEAAW
jgi:hypothetical protein